MSTPEAAIPPAFAELWIDGAFDAAHFLPHMPADHKCRRPHGHSYKVRAFVHGRVLPDGIVIDFDSVKDGLDATLALLDHHDLNTIVDNPTAEILAAWILRRLPGLVTRIELREVSWAGVVVRREDL